MRHPSGVNRSSLSPLCLNLAVIFVPGADVGLQIRSRFRGYRSVAGDVEENQVEGDKVSDESQQHHGVPPIPVALVQHPKHAPSWQDTAKKTNQSLTQVVFLSSQQRCHVTACIINKVKRLTAQRTHLGSLLCRCKCQRSRSNSLHLDQTVSWLRYTSRTPHCKK